MDRKLKIAIFHNVPEGGGKRALINHILYFKSKGHTVDVFTIKHYDFSKCDIDMPLKPIADNYYEFPMENTFFSKFIDSLSTISNKCFKTNLSKGLSLFFSIKPLDKTEKIIAEEINKKDYDIVHCDHDVYGGTPPFLKYIEKPTAYYCHEPVRDDKIINDLNNKISTDNYIVKKIKRHVKNKTLKFDREYAEYSTNILANSFFSHEAILKTFGKNSQVSYLGVNTDMFHPLNKERKNYVLSVGVIHPHKGFDFIIKSIAHIEKSIRPKLIIVTYNIQDNLLEYIKQLAKSKDVELEILASVSDEKLVELYNEAKLFVFGSFLEPFGLVSLEAMACGTPVVAVAEGGQREIIKDGETGFLVQRDEYSFSDAINKILTNEELWKEMSENCKKSIMDFWTLDHEGERLLNNFYKILRLTHDM